MIKVLLLACACASSIFMCTQLITYFYFNTNFPSEYVEPLINDSVKLINTIKEVHDVCNKLKIDLILTDDNYLKSFLSAEIAHRTSGVHNHQGCQIFCRQSVITFMIIDHKIDEKFDELAESFESRRFLFSSEEDFDKRDEDLEHRRGGKKLQYHVYLWKRDTLIHLVFAYPFHTEYMWTFKCNPDRIQQEKFKPVLSSKMFCHSSHLFKPIEKTKVVIDGIYIFIPQYLRTFLKDIQDSDFKFCDYNQARKFYSKNGFDSSPNSELFRANAGDLLRTATDVLKRLGVRFWLSSGTCLGWFRQCDFIPHSKDVDIGIWITDYNNRIIDKFEERGLKLIHVFGKINDSFELSFSMGDLKLDIFFFYKEKDHMWNGGTQARTGKKFKYLFDNFSLCWTYFNDLYVRVPCQTKSYILANYGENWNTLVKEWDWKHSPPNVKENGEWPKKERNEVIKLFKHR